MVTQIPLRRERKRERERAGKINSFINQIDNKLSIQMDLITLK